MFATLFSLFLAVVTCDAFCLPSDDCWPSSQEWEGLDSALSGDLVALSVDGTDDTYQVCYDQEDAYELEDNGNGVCMQYHNCRLQFCDDDSSNVDLPAYSVGVRSVADIQAVLAFAALHDISVTVKTSGHSYSGSSTAAGSILIWMRQFDGNTPAVQENYTDSCGTVYDNVAYAGGGNNWGELYSHVAGNFTLVGGGAMTVSAIGGWLMGGGLSALSRRHGFGVDNVVDFEIVLPNGTVTNADACHNSDLFWALRGGGGGAFGVVTGARYKLHEVQPIRYFGLEIAYEDGESFAATCESFWSKWVDVSPSLSDNWGGYWTLNSFFLYYEGDPTDAQPFIDDMQSWKTSQEFSDLVTLSDTQYTSYWNARDEGASTDETGYDSFSIGSRLVPLDFVSNSPESAVALLKDLFNAGFYTFNYFLGGATAAVTATATSMHPSARDALWQIEVVGDNWEDMMDILRNALPDSGSGYNHGARNEPLWRDAFWGSNYDRLLEIKTQLDPNNTLNCWHCVGYEGEEINDDSDLEASAAARVALMPLIVAIAVLLLQVGRS